MLDDAVCHGCARELAAHPGVSPRLVMTAALLGIPVDVAVADRALLPRLQSYADHRDHRLAEAGRVARTIRQNAFGEDDRAEKKRHAEAAAARVAAVQAELDAGSGRWEHLASIETLKEAYEEAKFGRVSPGKPGCLYCSRSRSKRWVFAGAGWWYCQTCKRDGALGMTAWERWDRIVAAWLGVDYVEGLAGRVLGVRAFIATPDGVPSLQPFSHISRGDRAALRAWAKEQKAGATARPEPVLARSR